MPIISVADLKTGEKGIIKEFTDNEVPLKLMELGCLPGNDIEMVQQAPFRDPVYLNINGTFLAIRREMAALIKIEKVDTKT